MSVLVVVVVPLPRGGEPEVTTVISSESILRRCRYTEGAVGT